MNWLKTLTGKVASRFDRSSGQRSEPTLDAPVAPPPLVNHDAIDRVDPYAFQATHRRMAWLLKLSTMTNVALMAVAVIEASAISELVPLQKLQLALVRIEPNDDKMTKVDPASLVRILPITQDAPGFDLAMESFVRRYARILLEIDKVSQDDRMREANLYSDAEYWKKFIADHLTEIKTALAQGVNRSIVVESADRVSMSPKGVARYAVDLVQTDVQDGKPLPPKHLRVYMALTSMPNTVRPSERFENPLGFRVLDLVKKEKGGS